MLKLSLFISENFGADPQWIFCRENMKKILALCSSFPEKKSWIFKWATIHSFRIAIGHIWVISGAKMRRYSLALVKACMSQIVGVTWLSLCNCGWDQQIISVLLGKFLRRLGNRKWDYSISRSYRCMQSSGDEQSSVEVPSCKYRICSVLTSALEGSKAAQQMCLLLRLGGSRAGLCNSFLTCSW